MTYSDIQISKLPLRKDRFLEIDFDTNIDVSIAEKKLRISGHDIAKTLWKASSYASGFLIKYGISARICADLDGGGRQGVFLYKNIPLNSDDMYSNNIAAATFGTRNTENWIYEAVLWEDARKDYKPSINRGKHKFSAETVRILAKDDADILQFINMHYLHWESYLGYAINTRSKISEWIDSKVDMIVKCTSCDHKAILSSKNLYDRRKLDFLDFTKKLVCVKCGSKNPIVVAN